MPAKLSGLIFGNYKLEDILGTGGMSLVYRAKQLNIEREVAIKIMAPALSAEEGFVHRFKQEAEIFAKLEHPHIVPIYDYDQHERYLYLVLRLINGGSLADKLESNAELTVDQMVTIVNQVAEALEYAHSKNIIHRDIKPGNIMLDEQGNAYLMDFGIAKVLSETRGGSISTLLGTPSYISPEQWQASTVDHRADIYSLGVVIYRMLTGQLPFTGGTPFYVMYSHLHEEIAKPSIHRQTIPKEVDEVVLKALAKQPKDRYQSAGDFARAFAAAAEKMKEAQDNKDSTTDLLNIEGRHSFRPDAKKDSRLDKLWIALERSSGHVFVTPNVEELFQATDERRTAKMSDIWDELERPATATYNTRRLQDLLEQIKKDHAFLGVKTQRVNLPKPIAEQLGRDSGLLLIAVESDSPAEQGGLYLGDLLVEIDGQPLRHQDDLMETLNDQRIDRAVSVRYVRTGQLMNTEIKLIKRESGKSAL